MRNSDRFFINNNFVLFFLSQMFLNCGNFIQIVAVAQLLVKNTNSGLITGFSIVCAPLPGIILSLFAGSIGDRFIANKLLVIFDLLRGFLVLLFILCQNTLSIFIIMLLINLIDVMYNPSRNKLISLILNRKDLLIGNSIMNGGYGAVSLIIPAICGIFISTYGEKTAFIANSTFYILSSLLLAFIKTNSKNLDNNNNQNSISEIKKGIKYCFSLSKLKKSILKLAIIDFGTISVNIAFYSLAFDTLKVTSRYWGLLLSIFYGMNFFSMLLLIKYKKWFGKHLVNIINSFMISVSFIWFFYSFTNNLISLFFGIAAEGLCLSICNTLLITYILEMSKKEYTARVIGIRDLFSNMTKLMGIGFTYLVMTLLNIKFVFIACALILFAFTIFQSLLSNIKDNI